MGGIIIKTKKIKSNPGKINTMGKAVATPKPKKK